MPDESGAEMSELQSAEEIVGGPAPILRDVRFFKMSVELIEVEDDHSEDDAPSSPRESVEEDAEAEISVNIGLRTRQTGPVIGVRIEFEASHEDWNVSLDAAAEYEASEPFIASEAARVDFADKVGVMTLYPYIREAVGNLTQRTVGSSFLLPTIRQGDVSFATETFHSDS